MVQEYNNFFRLSVRKTVFMGTTRETVSALRGSDGAFLTPTNIQVSWISEKQYYRAKVGNGRFQRRGVFSASACRPLFGALSLRFPSFIVWITSNSSVVRLLGKNSGLVQTETISGRGHSGGVVGPRENLRRKDFHVADVNHMVGESIGR
jgi:hypothetical protein